MSITDEAESAIHSDEGDIRELAALPKLDYERVRSEAAARLGCRAAILDRIVAKARKAEGQNDAKGRSITLYEPEPWPDPVNGAATLDEALKEVKSHMSIRHEHAVASVLWAAHTHVYDIFMHSPRLAVNAPEAECGKSLLMTLLVGNLVTRPQPVEIMKPAPFFRLAESHRPCFLIDECDVFIKEDSDLLAAINNGWQPQGGVIRCIGDDFEPRHFTTFTPVALGGIKLEKVLPATTISRSIVINLIRAIEGEVSEPFTPNSAARLRVIGRKIARWCADNRWAIAEADPALPGGAFNRRADRWRPLFKIAHVAGGSWLDRIRAAYLAEASGEGATLSIALQLLSDIRDTALPGDDRVPTEVIIKRLCNVDESPWERYNFKERDPDERKIQPRQLSAHLKPYGIKPDRFRIGLDRARGYYMSEMLKAANRYLPHLSSGTTGQVKAGKASGDSVRGTESNGVPDENPLKPEHGGGCPKVPDKSAPYPQKRAGIRI